jgi:hypothetical protein
LSAAVKAVATRSVLPGVLDQFQAAPQRHHWVPKRLAVATVSFLAACARLRTAAL